MIAIIKTIFKILLGEMFRIRIRTLIRIRVKIMIPKLTIIMAIKITAKRDSAFIFFYISACIVLSTIQME